MEQTFLTRTSMAGFWFVSVLLLSYVFSGNTALATLITRYKDTTPLVVAAIAAVVGIGAPPSIGFLLQRAISCLFTIIRRHPYNSKAAMAFGAQTRIIFGETKVSDPSKRISSQEIVKNSAVAQLVFHTHVDSNWCAWLQRRRTAAYASLTTGVAIVLALVLTFSLHTTSWTIWLAFIPCSAIFIAHGLREDNEYHQSIATWFSVKGASVIKKNYLDEESFIKDGKVITMDSLTSAAKTLETEPLLAAIDSRLIDSMGDTAVTTETYRNKEEQPEKADHDPRESFC